jgi:hypothetical protein
MAYSLSLQLARVPRTSGRVERPDAGETDSGTVPPLVRIRNWTKARARGISLRRAFPWFGSRGSGWGRRSGGLHRLLVRDNRPRRLDRSQFELGIDLLGQDGIFFHQRVLQPSALNGDGHSGEEEKGG